MKKKKTDTTGYSLAEIAIVIAFIILMLLLAGTMDYRDAKESAAYWKEQSK
jgi:hypothetical protein